MDNINDTNTATSDSECVTELLRSRDFIEAQLAARLACKFLPVRSTRHLLCISFYQRQCFFFLPTSHGFRNSVWSNGFRYQFSEKLGSIQHSNFIIHFVTTLGRPTLLLARASFQQNGTHFSCFRASLQQPKCYLVHAESTRWNSTVGNLVIRQLIGSIC